MTTNFADISHHQTSVDLAAYKAAGHTRIVMKATEGTGFTDPMFATRWKEAGRLGLDRVAYHFQRAKFNGADEFDHFYSVVQAAGGLTPRDRLCIDVEDTDTPDRAAAGCREFTARAVAKGVTQGIVYTYNYYAIHHAIAPSQFPAGWRHMWMADYTVGQADSDIELGAGWTLSQVVARQYTDKANVAGIGSTDYSHLMKDWLTVVDAVSTPTIPEDWFDMATQDDLENAVRKVLNEGTASGQKTWAGTEKAILGTVQGLVNQLNQVTYLLSYGDNADDSKDGKTHPNNLQEVRTEIIALDAKVSALVAALATASSGQFDLAAVEAAAAKGAADALANAKFNVTPAAAA